jgi:hypothetical protein
MNEQAITSRFRAHLAAGKTAAENKRLIVPHILAARSPRELSDTPVQWVQHAPGWLQTEWTEGDLVFENKYTLTEGQWATNLFQNGYQERPGSFTMRNVLLQPQLEPFNPGMRWGLRAHNMPEALFEDVDCYANLNSHGLYVSPYEDTTFNRCTFVRCGAQGIQVTYRPRDESQSYQGDNRHFAKKTTHVLRDSHFIDCGETGPSRSFAATYQNPGSQEFKASVLVENCSFVEDYSEPFGRYDWKSTGALLLSPMPFSQPEVLTSNITESLVVRNTLFDYTKGDRPMALIRSTDEVLFEDCMFIARDYEGVVSVNAANAHTGTSKVKRIVLRNNKTEGTVRLRINKDDQMQWNDWLLDLDMDTEGREVVIDAETGKVISDRPLRAEISPELLERIKAERETYFGRPGDGDG